MLVLGRARGQKIKIGRNITVSIQRVVGNYVHIGVEAPPEVLVLRAELDVDPAKTDKRLTQSGSEG